MNETYDAVVVGGGIIGSSIAWFLSDRADFGGSILVVEQDPTYATAATTLTNSCMRQQFSNPLNIKMSQFAAEFVRNFTSYMGDDPDVPELAVNHYGYMYLAGDEDFAATLRHNQQVQAALGAGTVILTPDEIVAAYPFYNVDGIVCGSHNRIDEGYFDGGTMFDQFRRCARKNGVSYAHDAVVGIDVVDERCASVRLASGASVACGTVVNAAGTRAAEVAALAGLDLAVEARKRFTFVFDCVEDLVCDLPLTIDPSGVHVRSDGGAYMAGCTPDPDPVVDVDDFSMDDDIWEELVWPALAHRIPAFERIKVRNRWAAHYAHNPLDHNVIVGSHPRVRNFVFANGFSGHGLQQSPAIGRGVAEWIAAGRYESLDLRPLGYDRIERGEPFVETAVI